MLRSPFSFCCDGGTSPIVSTTERPLARGWSPLHSVFRKQALMLFGFSENGCSFFQNFTPAAENGLTALPGRDCNLRNKKILSAEGRSEREDYRSMNKIEFVDQTIRDAQQSLWGFTMRTDHMTPIAETMDKVGYRAIATVGSQAFTVQVRNLNEDPWERIRVLSRLITRTPVRGSYQIGSLSSFDLSTPRDIITLWIKRSVANGIKSFWICDYQTDFEKFVYFARIAKAQGAEVVPALMYTSSPAHTSEHWARKTRWLAEAKECVDRIMIEDASGVITPEATRELVSTVLKNCDGLP